MLNNKRKYFLYTHFFSKRNEVLVSKRNENTFYMKISSIVNY